MTAHAEMIAALTVRPGTLDVSPAALDRLTPEQLAAWKLHDADTCADEGRGWGVGLQDYFLPTGDEAWA